MTAGSTGRESSVQVLGKASALLDLLADAGEASAATLAERLGEPRSTVYRLLNSLAQLGLVEHGAGRGRYRLGLRLLRLGHAAVSRFDVRAAALPVMEQLNESTGETVFLCVQRGDEAVCIEQIDGRRVQVLALSLGGSLPLHVGAAPRVLLAWEPRERWDEYGAGRLARFTDRTPADPGALQAELAAIRAQGYAVSDGDVTEGIAAIGAPVFDHRGAACAALSIAGVRPALLGAGVGDLVRSVVDGALAVSRALGHRELEAVADA